MLESSWVCVFWNTVCEDDEQDEDICADCLDLVPDHPYPRQMMQGIFALKHLLASGYKSSDVWLLQTNLLQSKY